MAWIATHWDRIPLHFGNRGIARTPLHVYGMPIFAAGFAALLLGVMLAIWYGSRRSAADASVTKIMLAVEYLMSGLFSAISLATALDFPVWLVPAVVPVAALAVIVIAVRAQSQPDDSRDHTPPECWHAAVIYYNPQDPALFVRARIGNGFTLNMANPRAKPFLIGTVGGTLLLTAFLIWSQR